MRYIPEGCAHGFLTLDESSDILYVICGSFRAEAGRGVRSNDPAFNIHWSAKAQPIVPRNSAYSNFQL